MTWRRLPPVYSPVPAGALARAFQSGARERLRSVLASTYGAQHVVLTDRGTTALELAIRLATAGREQIVALPAFGCYDLATAAIGAGARVALYDVDPATLGPDLDSLGRAGAAGAAAAVIAVPFGFAPDWPAIQAVARSVGAVLIEDAAQGHGGRSADRPLGGLGDIAILSFGRGKGWTGGAGGALLVRDGDPPAAPPANGLLAGLRSALLAAVLATAARPSIYRIPSSLPWLGIGETHYRAPTAPAALPASAAAILLAGRAASDREAGRRRRNGAMWEERLTGSTGLGTVDTLAGTKAGYLRFPVRLPPRARVQVLEDAADLGVVSTYPTTLAGLDVIRERRVDRESIPGAEALVTELVTLPTHGWVRPEEANRIARLVVGQGWSAPRARTTGRPG